jgi:hypothetical protein
MKDHGYKIERCYEYTEYHFNGNLHRYYPDFKSGSSYIEVKGYVNDKDKAKWTSVRDKGYTLFVIGIDEFKEFIHPYLHKTYGCKFGTYAELMTDKNKPLSPLSKVVNNVVSMRAKIIAALGIKDTLAYAHFRLAVKRSGLDVDVFLREIQKSFKDVKSNSSISSTSVISYVVLKRIQHKAKLGKGIKICSVDPLMIDSFLDNFKHIKQLSDLPDIGEAVNCFRDAKASFS